MLLYLLPLLLLASSTGTYAQRVTNFDYFDFDEPLSTLPRAGASSGINRGRAEVKTRPVAPSGGSSRDPQPTAHVPILQQINEHNEDGSYSYGYEAADGSFKLETRYPDGRVKGKYGYVDIHTGELKVIEYGADDLGFQPTGFDGSLGIVIPVVPGGNDNFTGNDNVDYDSESGNFDYVAEVADVPTPLPQFNKQGDRLAVINRARGSVSNTSPSGRIQQQKQPEQPTQNRGQDLRQPVTARPRPRTSIPRRPQSSLQEAPRRPQSTPQAVPRRPTGPPSAPVQPVANPNKSHLDPFSAFQTPFDFPRKHIEEIERRRPGQTQQNNQRRPSNAPPAIPQRSPLPPTRPPTPLTTTTEAPLATTFSPFRFRPQDAVRKTIPSIEVPQTQRQPEVPRSFFAPTETPRRQTIEQITQKAPLKIQSLIPRQQSVTEQEPANNKPIRIRAKDQSNFIQRQQQALRPREQQQEFTNPPELLEQPAGSEPEATTRRPTRPRNFDPRRQRVSINAANSLPTGEPTILPNINTASKKPQRVAIRQRGRARRPQQNTPQNTKPQTTETDKAQSAFPSFSAVEPTPVPTQATIQTQRPRASLATVQPTIQAIPLARRQSPRSFILPKESQVIEKPKSTFEGSSQKSRPTFSAFPARGRPQQILGAQQRTVEDLTEKDTASEQKRNFLLDAVLPTVRQPERSFAPTPLPQPQAVQPKKSSNSGSSSASRFSSFPIQNDTPSRPSAGSNSRPSSGSFRPNAGSDSRPSIGRTPPPSALPTRQSKSQRISPQISQPSLVQAIPRQRTQQLPKPEPSDTPRLVNFDALIQEFTGGRAGPNGKLEPSFFNAIPVDSQEARAGRRFNFNPQPAVPGASFELL